MVVKTAPGLSPLGEVLLDSLTHIRQYDRTLELQPKEDLIHVTTVGSRVSVAYEQLRNASEYADGSFFRQRSIRRFLNRNLPFHVRALTSELAVELIIELTQSDYLKNDSISKLQHDLIVSQIDKYYHAYWDYVEKETDSQKRRRLQSWLLDVLSIRCDQALFPNVRHITFTKLAFNYLYEQVPLADCMHPNETIYEEDYPLLLYVAIQKMILELDDLEIRTNLIDSYSKDITNIEEFLKFNHKIDYLIETKSLQRIGRVVSRNGAVLRFIYTGIFHKDAPIGPESLESVDKFEYAFRTHIEDSYRDLSKLIDSSIMKSVIFLILTKSLIGLAIEVPYDIIVLGHIAWVPLIINLFFPALFIASTRFTITTPSVRNTDKLIQQAREIIYGDPDKAQKIKAPKQTQSMFFSVIYAFMFVLALSVVSYILYLLGFSLIQGIIFVIFLSTGAFLAFRISNQVRELEVGGSYGSSRSLLHDLAYLPFIYLGQQISFRYAKINLISHVLDIFIELPLKTFLRVIRRWTHFLSNKRDEIL